MIDLFKTLTTSYMKSNNPPRPRGWAKFLTTLSELNILQASVSNPHAHEQFRNMKDQMLTDDEQFHQFHTVKTSELFVSSQMMIINKLCKGHDRWLQEPVQRTLMQYCYFFLNCWFHDVIFLSISSL